MSTKNFKEKREVSRTIRFTKTEIKMIYSYLKRKKMQFSDFARESVIKNISDES